MTYETAKKLKDAGYKMDYNLDGFSEYNKKTASIDISLSELVEACGEVFYDLQQKPIKEGWEATAFLSLATHAEGKGDTPEEAVANLWLRLNDKEALDNTPPDKV
jgi:hypothetical protein